MPMLPDAHQMDLIESTCLAIFDKGAPLSTLDIADILLDIPELPMHCPSHHYLTAATLLTAAHLCRGSAQKQLSDDLRLAKSRAATVPGGFCGQYGCCGAALGAGIFSCVWQKTSPMSQKGWAVGNQLTARCLAAIAEVEGPRCCKRVTYLTISAAIPAVQELMGINLGKPAVISCHHHSKNHECRKDACPFFPTDSIT